MSRWEWFGVLSIAVLVGIAAAICDNSTARADAPPPSSAQQRPDIFPCNGCNIQDRDGNGVGDMQDLNPLTLKAKQTRSVSYRLKLISGCNMGSYPSIMERYESHVLEEFGLTAVRNDSIYDHTVYISCGLVQINKCGSVNVFCLPDGFPYNGDVYMSDVLSGWDAGSQIGITCHEICGHATASWNEQYQVCGASCNFASTPGLSDFMNTGPLARHGVEAIECARWMRTMWADPPCAVKYGFITPDCSGPTVDWGNGVTATWNGCTGLWYASNGFAYEPATGYWYDNGVAWSPCTSWGGRDSPTWGLSVYGGQSVFLHSWGRWATAPSC